jgi:hypothetical protein
MSDAGIVLKFEPVIRAKGVFWVSGEYVRQGEVVHWECFLRLLGQTVRVGFDEYLEKYEDAVDLYEAYVREEFPDIPSALMFVLTSFPRVAEEMRNGEA